MGGSQVCQVPIAHRRIGHVDIAVATARQALDLLLDAVRTRSPGAWSFCNAHTVNLASQQVNFRDALQGIRIFNDGVGVDLASRQLYGDPFPENLNGTDLTPRLLAALPTGTRVYVLGGGHATIEKARDAISVMFPNIFVAGTHHGYFSADECDRLLKTINELTVDLVIVGLGQPLQEEWASKAACLISAPILCVGALIDRFAGNVPRAPIIIRRLRAEWLFRLALEPRRLSKRYLWGNVLFLYNVQRQRNAMKLGRS